jgi:hypothetical protein
MIRDVTCFDIIMARSDAYDKREMDKKLTSAGWTIKPGAKHDQATS